MNKETYIEQRNELLEKAQQLINEGKISEFNDIKAQIEKLDNDYEEYTKAQANLNSLQDNHKITDIQNICKLLFRNVQTHICRSTLSCLDESRYTVSLCRIKTRKKGELK